MPKDLRTTQNMVRKSLFDSLGQDLEEISFLDLFAGSGANGLEALSRGAQKVTFVEKNPKHVQVIEENLILLLEAENRLDFGECEVVARDVFASIKALFQAKQNFDVIFLDPPYSNGLGKKALKTLGAYDIVHPNSLVVVQHAKREILPEKSGRIVHFREKVFGSTILSFYKVASENQ